ncbi:hypothetical protein [Paraburkholderia sp. BCC1876]|uniref:hypothetical protein n=1 Tax=Paraburkholderia sp. BCC1876 TaxID=2676303 RepID=UPI00159006B1|nr:hypothetical protein [Paraburkholderia sp. BCC1876]
MKVLRFLVSHSGMAETATYRFNVNFVCSSGMGAYSGNAEASFSGIKRPEKHMQSAYFRPTGFILFSMRHITDPLGIVKISRKKIT